MAATEETRGVKRKIEVTGSDGSTETLEITPLGGGNEVGRSCVLMKFKAYSGMTSLPFFDVDEVDPSKIDLLLVSHFHLDHSAALPFFLEKTTFKGRVFMTHPTKAIYKMLLTDFIRVSNVAVEDQIFDEQDINRSMDKIEAINFHQELEHNGIKFWCYGAGHVLGAAMFMVEIAGIKVLYTGDFSRQEDRHLMAAEVPDLCPDVLIVESTYGVQIHEPRKERESRFLSVVTGIVKRGGHCLIPAFALGRAQELLLILEEHWNAHNELKGVPIYFASTIGKRSMAVYQTYTSMMNERIRRQSAMANPFVFNNIRELTSFNQYEETGPCVIMASPGMLQSGLSRQLFDIWASNKKNGVLIPGYVVEGTLAKEIMSEPEEVTSADGRVMPLRLSVHYISFSAHTDFEGTSTFIDALAPPNVILVHGEKNEMQRLSQALVARYENKRKIEILSPRNVQTVKLTFRGHKTAKAVGTIAHGGPQHLGKVSGILVQKDFQFTLVAPQDLNTYAKIQTTEVSQSMSVNYAGSWDAAVYQIKQLYEDTQTLTVEDKSAVKVHNAVTVVLAKADRVDLEWVSTPMNDMITDSIVSVLLQIGANPAHFQVSKFKTEQELSQERYGKIERLLAARFGPVEADPKEQQILIKYDGQEALYHFSTRTVEANDEALVAEIDRVLRHVHGAVLPIPKAGKPSAVKIGVDSGVVASALSMTASLANDDGDSMKIDPVTSV